MRPPFEKFLLRALDDFERNLKSELTERGVRDRMLGARQFAAYLAGRPHRKGQRTDLGRPVTGTLPFRK